MKELIERIEMDIAKAKVRKDSHHESGNLEGWNYERGVIYSLKTVLFDMKELNLIKNQ